MNQKIKTVFYCNIIYEHPQTGGEIFFAKILSYLKSQPNINLLLPTKEDLNYLKRSHNCLEINRYFFHRFRRLPKGTIIIEGEQNFPIFFIANMFTRMLRNDISLLVSVLQVPDPLEGRFKQRMLRDNVNERN